MTTNKVQIPKEMIDYYNDLAKVRSHYLEKRLAPEITEEIKKTHLEQKVPLLNFIDLDFDELKLKEIFQEIIKVISLHRSQINEDLSAIEKSILEKKGVLAKLCKDFIWQRFEDVNKFAQENDLNRDILSLTLYQTVKTMVTSHSLGLQNVIDRSNWQENYCPVCGWAPGLAYEEQETSKRSLHCSMCDTEWEYKNLKCPHCGNEEHNTLKYFSIDGDEIYRVYVCDKCLGYIKSINKGKVLKKMDYTSTDLNTLHLDLLAEKEGYKRNPAINKEDRLN